MAKPDVRAAKGEATRNRILDACELLFSQRGYVGTSLRDIAALADARLSLVHYHFGTKDQILSATIDRKVEPLRALIADSFAETARTKPSLTIEDAVRAFIRPLLLITADQTHPLRHFVIMTSHLMSAYRMPEVRPSLMRLDVISGVLHDHLRQILPPAAQAEMLTATYIMEAALVFMVQDPGFLDDFSNQRHSTARIDEIIEPTLRFFTAGLTALTSGRSPPRPASSTEPTSSN